jgi:hypothetical protein
MEEGIAKGESIPPLGRGGHRFDPVHLHQVSLIIWRKGSRRERASRLWGGEVIGSIPFTSTILKLKVESSKLKDLLKINLRFEL